MKYVMDFDKDLARCRSLTCFPACSKTIFWLTATFSNLRNLVVMGLLHFGCLLTITGVLCHPSFKNAEGNFSFTPLSAEDHQFLSTLRNRRAVLPAGFKYLYVDIRGGIHPQRTAGQEYIEISGSPHSSQLGLNTAAYIVSQMLLHADPNIFHRLANHAGGGLGIFTASEKITVYPELVNLADTPACAGTCTGSCSHTCTFDGRKYSNLGGLTTSRSMVLEDNVLCTANDPHHSSDNIVVHEFAHSLENFGMSSTQKSQVAAAYNHAKTNNIWTPSSYAMANQAEYFAVASGSFFHADKQISTSGGMNLCGGRLCSNESENRNTLSHKDPQLYSILVSAYLNGQGTTHSGLDVCMKTPSIVG